MILGWSKVTQSGKNGRKKFPNKNYERLGQMEQENGWQKFHHHKWCFRGHQTVDCRLQTVDCRLQTVDCRLQTLDCRLQTVDFRLQTVDCRLQTLLQNRVKCITTGHTTVQYYRPEYSVTYSLVCPVPDAGCMEDRSDMRTTLGTPSHISRSSLDCIKVRFHKVSKIDSNFWRCKACFGK